MAAEDTKDRIERHASRYAQQGEWVEKAAQIGLIAKGLLYTVIAVLSLQLAFGVGGQTTDQTGALRAVREQPGGAIVLSLLALGLLGYGLWRLVQAFQDPGEDSEAKNVALRISFAIRFLLYLGLAVLAVRLVAGGGGGGGGGGAEQTATATVLSWPAGQWLVGLVGLVIIGVGLYQGKKGWRREFFADLSTQGMSPAEYAWVRRLGTAGLLARMVVFVMVGVFVVQAALQHDPQEAQGLDGALQQLASSSYGPWLLGLVAAGLLCYGLFCFVQSRYVRTDAS